MDPRPDQAFSAVNGTALRGPLLDPLERVGRLDRKNSRILAELVSVAVSRRSGCTSKCYIVQGPTLPGEAANAIAVTHVHLHIGEFSQNKSNPAELYTSSRETNVDGIKPNI